MPRLALEMWEHPFPGLVGVNPTRFCWHAASHMMTENSINYEFSPFFSEFLQHKRSEYRFLLPHPLLPPHAPPLQHFASFPVAQSPTHFQIHTYRAIGTAIPSSSTIASVICNTHTRIFTVTYVIASNSIAVQAVIASAFVHSIINAHTWCISTAISWWVTRNRSCRWGKIK